VIAADRPQARTILRYATALLEQTPLLAPMLVSKREESLELSNRTVIEVRSASFRSVRGYTLAAALLDETAFWRSDESANPDKEILTALRPSLMTLPGSLLIGASSPYAKRGVLFEAHRDHHGRDASDVLVWQAPTRTMNPMISEAFVAKELEKDPASARAEYLAQFREDVSGYIDRELLESLVVPQYRTRAYRESLRYAGFCDPSGGARDSMTLAIAHREGTTVLLDAIDEVRAPFNPSDAVKRFAELLRIYRVDAVEGDAYGGEWPRERFREHGITYKVSELTRTEIYGRLLPLMTSGEVKLLDSPRLINQLATLERRMGRSGRDIIDHQPGSHDDLANAAAGALVLARHLSIGPSRRLASNSNMPWNAHDSVGGWNVHDGW
jgi:hypothetical protein